MPSPVPKAQPYKDQVSYGKKAGATPAPEQELPYHSYLKFYDSGKGYKMPLFRGRQDGRPGNTFEPVTPEAHGVGWEGFGRGSYRPTETEPGFMRQKNNDVSGEKKLTAGWPDGILEEEVFDMFYSDYTLLLLIPAMILALYAQARVSSTYHKYSKQLTSARISGAEAASQILGASGAGFVKVEKVPGNLTDHYDPRKKILRLSEGVYESPSIAALGIAAHEAGHALQHHAGYAPLHFRNGIYPLASFSSKLAFPLFFIGLIFSQKGPSMLMDIGILLFAVAVLFSVITLPVEFDASRRAMALLRDGGYLRGTELDGARKVLSAAALTYVAATTMAVLQLLRMVMIRNSRD